MKYSPQGVFGEILPSQDGNTENQLFQYYPTMRDNTEIINRPNVAGAVLQTALLLINSVTHSSFLEISLRRRHALMDFAEWVDLTYWSSFSGGGSVIIGAYPV